MIVRGKMSERQLVYKFLSLPYRQRFEIINKLGLLNDTDKGVADMEMYRIAFRRAQKLGLLEQLRTEVNSFVNSH